MTPFESDTTLAAFLQACRARVRPEQAGVPTYGERRRVPGLRREELALLAGVSSSYLTRLEQGLSTNASPQVLDALASALQLGQDERAHLHALAADPVRRPARRTVQQADPGLLELLAASPSVPGLILGRTNEVLAWNALGHVLLAPHLPFDAPDRSDRRPNMTRMVFLDPQTRSLYADWNVKARRVVGNLRLATGRHPDDPGLSSLVGELAVASKEFAALWADHRVEACASASYVLAHPAVGRLTVRQQALRPVDAIEQSLVLHTVEHGSPSAEALTLLAHVPDVMTVENQASDVTGRLERGRS